MVMAGRATDHSCMATPMRSRSNIRTASPIPHRNGPATATHSANSATAYGVTSKPIWPRPHRNNGCDVARPALSPTPDQRAIAGEPEVRRRSIAV